MPYQADAASKYPASKTFSKKMERFAELRRRDYGNARFQISIMTDPRL